MLQNPSEHIVELLDSEQDYSHKIIHSMVQAYHMVSYIVLITCRV